MKLNLVKFINAVTLLGTTYGYADSKKHGLEIDLKEGVVSLSNGKGVVMTPIANVISFEYAAKESDVKTELKSDITSVGAFSTADINANKKKNA